MWKLTASFLFSVVLASVAASVRSNEARATPSICTGITCGNCAKGERYDSITPTFNSDGGRMTWVLRDMSAPDWQFPADGFASQVLWVGTNSSNTNDDWVEVGATQGFEGLNLYTYYTGNGHKNSDGTYSFSESRITSITPVAGTTQHFSEFKYPFAGQYQIAIAGTVYWSWLRDIYTINYAGGFEATCASIAQVNRTYVSENQFRRYSDGTWIDAPNGTFISVGGWGSMAWCRSPVTFRYALNSTIDPSLCA